MSLVSFSTLPPNKYHHALSQDPHMAMAARKSAIKDYKVLLEAESAERWVPCNLCIGG